MHFQKTVAIKKIIEETETVKTFVFDFCPEEITPGQFLMVWNFKDEKPMSVSLIDREKKELGISIKNVGPFTRAVHSLKVGDKLGLRGPYGHGFELTGSKILAIGGGVGMAPVAAFVDDARSKGVEVDVVTAAATKDELLFMDKFKSKDISSYACTDDGSLGFCGFATEYVEEILKENHYDMIVTCGPEIMMKGIFEIAKKHNIEAQFSLERYMKCGIGLCGQCCVDDVGWRVCVEGPVFSIEQMELISEFGKYRRDASGIKHDI